MDGCVARVSVARASRARNDGVKENPDAEIGLSSKFYTRRGHSTLWHGLT